MTVQAPGDMSSAITALETEHKWLLERLAKVETAIAVLHDLRAPKLPLAPAPADRADVGTANRDRQRARPARPAAGAAELLPAAVRAALADGPLPVAELLERSGATRYYLQQYLERGLVVAVGTTTNRRVSLPGPRPAKEEP